MVNMDTVQKDVAAIKGAIKGDMCSNGMEEDLGRVRRALLGGGCGEAGLAEKVGNAESYSREASYNAQRAARQAEFAHSDAEEAVSAIQGVKTDVAAITLQVSDMAKILGGIEMMTRIGEQMLAQSKAVAKQAKELRKAEKKIAKQAKLLRDNYIEEDENPC